MSFSNAMAEDSRNVMAFVVSTVSFDGVVLMTIL